jgi:hypothetical protein
MVRSQQEFSCLYSEISILEPLVDKGNACKIEVVTAVTMKNAVLWDVMLYGSCKNLRFRGTWRLHHQGDKNR